MTTEPQPSEPTFDPDEDQPPTVVADCPAFDRLAELMARDGKQSRDTGLGYMCGAE